MPIQIILVIVALVGLGAVIRRFQKKESSWFSLVVWFFLWLAVGIVALVPNSTAHVAKFLGVGRGADVAVYAALVILFFTVFRCLVALEKMRRDITLLVRRLALLEEGQDKNFHV